MIETMKQEFNDLLQAVVRQRDEALNKLVQTEAMVIKLNRELQRCRTVPIVSKQDTEQANVQDEEKE